MFGRCADAAAKGYLAVSALPPGNNFKILETLKKQIIDAGKSDLKDTSKFGTVYYNFVVIKGILAVETFRTGQEKFGHRPLNTEEGQWALEHLDLISDRIATIGATGLVSPIKVTWLDQVGGGSAKIQEWTGDSWKPLMDWLQGDGALFHDVLEEKALSYAKEKNLAVRTNADANGVVHPAPSLSVVPGVLFATRSPRMTPTPPILAVEDVHVIYGQVPTSNSL